MKDQVDYIIKKILQKDIHSIREIKDFGSVNIIFELEGDHQNYIIRLNEEGHKLLEYQKENWCIHEVAKLGIPGPKVLSIGMHKNIPFMIQEKIPGRNGKAATSEERDVIWKELGKYAAQFQYISRIDLEEVEKVAFHSDWKSRLEYNLEQLGSKDSLVRKKILSAAEQEQAKFILSSLKSKDFKMGLVHGDLCPRNVILNEGTVYLLDWGTAEINIIPHTEIGILLMSEEASKEEARFFLNGMGISDSEFLKIEKELKILNFLHRLDKHRWAEEHAMDHLPSYAEKVRTTFDQING